MERPTARRAPSLVLLCLTVFLLLFPLTLTNPGLPTVLKADAAAFYLASLSLWHDGDFRCENHDARRLFREYPLGTEHLILMGRGGGEAYYFGVPIVYPIAATPFVALFGGRGMVLLNSALLLAMVWMAFSYLRRYNDDVLALFFAISFFLLSTTWIYVFWLQAEILNTACVMAAFYWALRGVGEPDARNTDARHTSPRRLLLHAVGSGTILAVAGYGKPMLVALALPILYLFFKARSWRGLLAFTISGVLTVGALAGTAQALTEEPWPYFAPRQPINVWNPVELIERRVEPRWQEEPVAPPTRQIRRVGRQLGFTLTAILFDAAPEFLFGRHGSFFVYMPFAVLAIVFFSISERRSVFRWLILVSAAATAVLFLTIVRGYWLGGGGFVGNRFFITVYPCFLFLVRRIHPPWLIAGGYAAVAVFLGPLLVMPQTSPVRQSHVLSPSLKPLPMEWSLMRSIPGYEHVVQSGIVLHGHAEEISKYRDELWLLGARRVGLDLLSEREAQSFVFDVRNLAPGNTIELCLLEDCRTLRFDDVPPQGSSQRVVFGAQRGTIVPRAGKGEAVYRYPMRVSTAWGEAPRWRGSHGERFYLGAALIYLGTPEELAKDLYGVEWLEVADRESMLAGQVLQLPVRLRNTSAHSWPARGPTRVRIAYHWLGTEGERIVWEGKRTELPTDLAPGAELELAVRIEAPRSPGRHVLALDLVRERVQWFSDTDTGLMAHQTVEILGTTPAPDASSDRAGESKTE